MALPGQKHVSCEHVMVAFDLHSKCVQYRDKGLGSDTCVLKTDCQFCNVPTSYHESQLATPTYRKRPAHIPPSTFWLCPDSKAG